MYVEVIKMMEKVIIENFQKGLIKVFLGTNTEYTYSKFINVEIGFENPKTWIFWIGSNLDCYTYISLFLEDLIGEIDCMEYADGIQGVEEFLDDLTDDDEISMKFLIHYDTVKNNKIKAIRNGE